MYSKFETMFDRDKVNMIGKEMRIEPKFVSLINYVVVCHGVLSCKPLLALVCSDGPPRTSAVFTAARTCCSRARWASRGCCTST